MLNSLFCVCRTMKCDKSVCCVLLAVVMGVVATYGHKKHRSKGARLLTFETLDDDMKIDLEFTIPFLTIPIKKTMESTFGLDFPTININTAALALGGGVVLTTVFLVPFLIKSANHYYPHTPYARILDKAEFGSDTVLELSNQFMLESGGLQRCVLKVACWVGRSASAEDTRNILSHVSSMMPSMVNVSALAHAARRVDCDAYDQCPISRELVTSVADRLKTFLV